MEAMLGEARPWIWLLAPLAGVVLLALALALPALRRAATGDGAGGTASERLRRRRVADALLGAVAVATLAALAFAAFNLAAEIEPSRKLANIGLWFLGTILGAAAALPLPRLLVAGRGARHGAMR